MFGLSEAQLIAIAIMLAFFGGATTVLAVLYSLMTRSEEKHFKSAKHRMEKNADLDHIEQALAIANS